MARHKLENELIAIEVEEHGAELKSLVRKNTGKEYMWKADPKFGRRITGINVSVCWSGKRQNVVSYQRTDLHHGTARFAPRYGFYAGFSDGGYALVCIKSNEETMAKYPYAFTLRIGYHIEEK